MATARELQNFRNQIQEKKDNMTPEQFRGFISGLDRSRSKAKEASQGKPIIDESRTDEQGRPAFVGFGTGVAKGAIQSLQNIGNVIAKPIGKAFGIDEEDIGFDEDIFEAQTKAEKWGKGTERVAEFLIPGGRILKGGKAVQAAVKGSKGGRLRSFLGLGGRAATESAGFTTIGSIQRGEFDTPTAVIAGAIPFIGPTVKPLGGFLANTLFGVKGVGAVKNAFHQPDQVSEFLKTARRQMGGKTVGDITKQVQKGYDFLQETVDDAYTAALESLPKRLGRNPRVLTEGGKTTIRAGGKTYTLSTLGAKQHLTKLLKKNNVMIEVPTKKEFIEEGGKLKIIETPLDRAEQNKLVEIFDDIHTWRDSSPAGLNRLAQKVAGYRRAGDTGTTKQFNLIVDDIRRGIRDYIGKRVPRVKQMNEQFSEGMDFLDKFRFNVLGTSNKSVEQTVDKLRQIAVKLDDPFEKEATEALIVELEKKSGVSIIGQLRALSTALTLQPQSQSSRGLWQTITDLLVRTTASGAMTAGRIEQKTRAVRGAAPEGLGKGILFGTKNQ